MKKIFIALILILDIVFLTSCCNNINSVVIYEIVGTKTNITIKYRGVNSNKIQEENITTTITKKLPWEISCHVSQSTCIDKKQWFLSAYSESEGEMTVIINGYSNTTTNKYIELFCQFGSWSEGYFYTNKD